MRSAIAVMKTRRYVRRPTWAQGSLGYLAWAGLGWRDSREYNRRFPIVLAAYAQGAENLWRSQHPVTRQHLEALGYTPEQLAWEVREHLRMSARWPDEYRVRRDLDGRLVLALLDCCPDRWWAYRRDYEERRQGLTLSHPWLAVVHSDKVPYRVRAAVAPRKSRLFHRVVLTALPHFEAPSSGTWRRKKMGRLHRMVYRMLGWFRGESGHDAQRREVAYA